MLRAYTQDARIQTKEAEGNEEKKDDNRFENCEVKDWKVKK